jgi:beta-galactosidase GanA
MTESNPSSLQQNPDHRLHLGASWYPEMWPETEWPKDIARMNEVGFTMIRLFEFAWKKFEPQEGSYEFTWAVKVLDQLHAAGIQVMIGTPTAAPPAWLTTRYPEVLKTASSGKRAVHGARKHYNPHSKKYRELSVGIVSKMVEALGDHPAVHSWQIDNEMSGFDYGEESLRQFHAWLEKKYGSIENLNAVWGLQFWSQAYDEFSQIPMCTASVGSIEMPERNHPSLIMAVAHFQNEGWTSFMRAQIEVIRKGPPTLITSNMTGFIGQMDWDKHFKPMDRAGVSSYADLSYFSHNTSKMDRLRPMKEAPYWLLETAPNWSGGGPIWNIHHNEDGLRLYTWVSILLGGSMVLYWQWRSHWAGQEMQHGTCVGATGAWMPGKEGWSRLSREFAQVSNWMLEHPAARGPIAVMTSTENAWVYSIDPMDPVNVYGNRIREDYYQVIRDAQYQCDLILSDTDLTNYKLILCPQMAILPEETRSRLADWVEAGGRLVLGPMTGQRSDEMTAWTDQTFGGLEDLMGADSSCRFTPHWVEKQITVTFTDGLECNPRIWCEGFAPREGTEVMARYRGGYGDGHAAVVSRVFGKGRVVSLGCPLDDACLKRVIDVMGAECGVKPLMEAEAKVLACPRVNASGDLAGMGVANTTYSTQDVILPSPGQCLFSGDAVGPRLSLEPLEVRIIRFDRNEDPVLDG